MQGVTLHLVEIEDDVFAVFTIAKDIEVEKNMIENIFTNFKNLLEQYNKKDILLNSSSEILGKLKWKVIEYEKILVNILSIISDKRYQLQ